jgi:hypothetical protein
MAEKSERAEIQKENEVLKSLISNVASGRTEEAVPLSPTMPVKTYEKMPIVSMDNKQKKEDCIRQCIGIVKEKRYKLLYELVSSCSKGLKYEEKP